MNIKMNTKKRACPSLSLGAISLLIVLSLMAGCYKPAAPDVTQTPAADADAAPSEESMMATALAESARATEMAHAAPTVEAPTSPPPTSTPTPAPTATSLITVTITPAPTTLAPTATSPPTGQATTHTVQRGENLFRIALRYGTTVEAITSANGIANPALIYVGQALTIPSSGSQPPSPTAGETTYVVQPGDNLFRIALRYNMSYLYLAQYNGIANPAHIYSGQVLRIPPR